MHPELCELGGTLHKKSYHKHEVVLHHGDKAAALWLVLSGWVKITRQTPDGKESVIGLCSQGDVFGEAALFPHANYPYHAEVMGEDAELLTIPAEMIRGLIAQNAALSATIMSMLNERTAQAQLKLEHMSTMSAAQRLGCFLLRLCHTHTEGTKTLQIPVEKHVLATYLGMKPETLSRSQQQLKEVGVEVAGHEVTITRIAALRQFVCNSCSESGSGNCAGEETDVA
jgi:CRP-like cAMP-binding protein